jgi:hypothetical protein
MADANRLRKRKCNAWRRSYLTSAADLREVLVMLISNQVLTVAGVAAEHGSMIAEEIDGLLTFYEEANESLMGCEESARIANRARD